MSVTVDAGVRMQARDFTLLLPAGLAAVYPFLVLSYRAVVSGNAASAPVPAALLLALLFGVSLSGIFFARRTAKILHPTVFQLRARRLAYLSVAVPPLYVFAGVANSMAGRPVPQEWTWCVLWLMGGAWCAMAGRQEVIRRAAPRWIDSLRGAHAAAGAILLLFIAFHLGNHFMGLAGKETHAAVMEAGRGVYRRAAVEPILALLFLGQAIGGLTLAWRWSAMTADGQRIFQIASGVYLAAFVTGHMNTILIYARFFLKTETGWNFMTGSPPGLLNGPIHLFPHYALAVFFVLGHLASGARAIAIRRGARREIADNVWRAGLAIAALISAATMTGLAGVQAF